MKKEAVIEKIQSYAYNYARLQEVQEQLDSICIKVTPTYGNLAATSKGTFSSSKVEKIGNCNHELKQKISIYEHEVKEVENMIEHSGLDEREKGVMWWLARNGKLQAYARRERIGKDNVYKIRDRAIKKIVLSIKHKT